MQKMDKITLFRNMSILFECLISPGLKPPRHRADHTPLPRVQINLLKTKRRLLYLKTQSVPRR